MNNREKLINRLQTISPELQAELDYYMEIDHEGFSDEREYDLTDAFDEAVDLVIDHRTPKLLKEVHQIYIDIGFAVVRDPNTQTFGGHGKKYWFKKGGIEYDPVMHWTGWIEE